MIVVEENEKWDTIRLLDVMWLTNLHEEDIYMLYKSQMLFAVEDMDQALQFIRVIRTCFAFAIHVGVNLKEKSKEMLKLEDSKMIFEELGPTGSL